MAKYRLPIVVALNKFITDSDEELDVVRRGCKPFDAQVALCEVWEKGGEGGIELGEMVVTALDKGGADFKPLYDVNQPIKDKIEIIAKEIYRGGVEMSPKATRAAQQLEDFGLGKTPVCIAKTQYSFSDNPALLGAPTDFRIDIRDVYPSAGAGFVVALAGDIMTMPGLSKSPAAERMRISDDGAIEGLF